MKKTISIAIGAIVSAFFLYFLFTQIRIGDVAALFRQISFLWLLGAFAVYALSYALRALRFNLLLKKPLGFRTMFHVVAVQTMLIDILPVRTGEFSYLYMLKKQKVEGSSAASSLIIGRIFDMVIIGIIFLAALVVLHIIPKALASAWITVGIFVAFLLLGLFSLVFYGDRYIAAGRKVRDFFRIGSISFIKKGLTFIKHTIMEFKHVASMRKMALLFFYTALIWASQYITTYLLMLSINVPLGISVVVVSVTFMILSTLLPIQGIAGFGTLEGSWALGLVLFGVEKKLAIATALYTHLAAIFFFLLLGAVGFMGLRKRYELSSPRSGSAIFKTLK
ncbi:flippase-like domain-containing protein [Candidatus Woesearchaeota archaeon]|nr:flippase-like domain-containing protein [Candidatus Woesearchaeota archaeon]